LWGYQEESKMIEYVRKVKQGTNLPITIADEWHQVKAHPDLMDELDYISIHIHPYWEGIHIDDAAQFVIDGWDEVKDMYPNKEVVLGETGWPTAGENLIVAVPSEDNQKKFLEDMIVLNPGGNYLFFEAFDEEWKRTNEGEVGAHWGILFSDGRPKLSAESLLNVIGHRTNKGSENNDLDNSSLGCYISSMFNLFGFR